MEDLLEDLRARDQALVVRDGPFEQVLGVGLVGVRGPDEVHGNVRIDEDHDSVT